MAFKWQNGWLVRDKITGFKGRITGRADYITGCNQYLLQPEMKEDGTFIEPRWFDEHRLQLEDATFGLSLSEIFEESKSARIQRVAGADSPAPVK